MLFSVMKKKLYLKEVIPTLHRAITLTNISKTTKCLDVLD